jgi:antitoxin HicB
VTDSDRYPARVFWNDEDDGFIATAPDLPGCSAFGKTQQEALTQLQDAIVAWIEAAQSAKNPIPEPSRPALESKYSGRVLLRMPRALHLRLAQGAELEDVSLNQYIVFLLASAVTPRSSQAFGDISAWRFFILEATAPTRISTASRWMQHIAGEWQVGTLTFHGVNVPAVIPDWRVDTR